MRSARQPRPSPATTPPPARRAWVAATGALVISGLALRIAAARDDFWFDEIWSYFIARAVPSWWSIVTTVHHDNNHYLNTLFLYLLGEQSNWFVYRIPTIVAGSAAVAFAGLAVLRFGRLEAGIATALMALSYPMIQYSSEARGYAFAVAAALGCYLVGTRYRARPTIASGLLFSLVASLGLLSHLTFYFFLAALVAWLAAQARAERLRLGRAISYVGVAVGPALVFAALLWWVTVRLTQIGGGPTESFVDAFVYTLSYSAGGPAAGAAGLLITGLAIAVIVGGVLRLRREAPADAVLFASAILVPTLALAARQAVFVHPRYFLIALAFALLAASLFLAQLWTEGGPRRWLAAALTTLTIAGNGSHIVQFLRIGRGDYDATVRYVWEHSAGEEIVVSGDHEMRVPYLLGFYGRRMPGKRFRYVHSTNLSADGAEWFLLHRFDDKPLPDEIGDRFKNRYHLVRKSPFYGLSGWYWYLYQRNAAADAPSQN